MRQFKFLSNILILTVVRCPPISIYFTGTSLVGGTGTRVVGNLTVVYWEELLSPCEVITFTSSLPLSNVVVISSDILSLDMPLSLYWDVTVAGCGHFSTCCWLYLMADVILWWLKDGLFWYNGLLYPEVLAPPCRG